VRLTNITKRFDFDLEFPLYIYIIYIINISLIIINHRHRANNKQQTIIKRRNSSRNVETLSQLAARY